MQKARVIGNAVSTAKHATLSGFRLMIMQPLGVNDRPDGDPLIVVDTQGAAIGSIALISTDGKFARDLVGTKATPLRYTTMGIIDE